VFKFGHKLINFLCIVHNDLVLIIDDKYQNLFWRAGGAETTN
jgi:hypothetical protein